MSNVLAELAEGSIFAGDFRIVRKLGAGGMGAIYVAEQVGTGRQRALKLMHPGMVASEDLRQKFALEAKVGARIASEHVVEVVAAGIDAGSGVPWLAMELLVGQDLARHVEARGPMALADVALVLDQVGHALAAAHDAGIVHRDLKPENVFMAQARRANESFIVKLLDFGIAKVVEEARGTNTGVMGSPLWMAPEQTEHHATITPATDVWALALVAFYMLTGKNFWRAAAAETFSFTVFLRELVLDDLVPASARAGEVGAPAGAIPTGFDDWFARCVVRDREARFPDARAALDGFHAAMRGLLPDRSTASGSGLGDVASRSPSRPGGTRPATTGAQLGTARTLVDARSTPNDPARDSVPDVVPVAPPRWKTIGAVAGGALALGVGFFALRGPSSIATGGVSDAGAIAAAVLYCPKGMVRVPAAEMTVGTADGPAEETPPHTVKVAALCVDEGEVTVDEYAACVAAKGCTEPLSKADWPNIPKDEQQRWSPFCNYQQPLLPIPLLPTKGRGEHPMNCVTFDEARAYCRYARGRLPNEAEWELAARGTDGRPFPWGFDPPSPERLNVCDDGCTTGEPERGSARSAPVEVIGQRFKGDDHWKATAPSGAFAAGVSPFGAFDMAGNVAEWTESPFCPYSEPACGAVARVVRGGSWVSESPAAVHTTSRVKMNPAARTPDIGFRCVK
jgi:eukaryotic-like serine/threonine-protein kinase